MRVTGKYVYERSLFSSFIGSGGHEGTWTQTTKGKVNETVTLKEGPLQQARTMAPTENKPR